MNTGLQTETGVWVTNNVINSNDGMQLLNDAVKQGIITKQDRSNGILEATTTPTIDGGLRIGNFWYCDDWKQIAGVRRGRIHKSSYCR